MKWIMRVIRKVAEESYCRTCGCPLYVGDNIISGVDMKHDYCSESCYKQRR